MAHHSNPKRMMDIDKLTQVVRTLAAALSKWKARTLLMPSVMSVNT